MVTDNSQNETDEQFRRRINQQRAITDQMEADMESEDEHESSNGEDEQQSNGAPVEDGQMLTTAANTTAANTATAANTNEAQEVSEATFRRDVVSVHDANTIRRQKDSIKRFVQKEGFKRVKFVVKKRYDVTNALFKGAMRSAVGEGWDETKDKAESYFITFASVVLDELKRKRANVMGTVRNEMKNLLCDDETKELFTCPEDIWKMTSGALEDTDGMYTLLMERIIPIVHGKTEFQTEFLNARCVSPSFVSCTTEAFASLLIENGAHHWWDVFRLKKPPLVKTPTRDREDGERVTASVSSLTDRGDTAFARKYKYVNGGKGATGFQGWSDKGIARFNYIFKSVQVARVVPSGKSFYSGLKTKWVNAAKASGRSKRKKLARDELLMEDVCNDEDDENNVQLKKIRRSDGTEYYDTMYGCVPAEDEVDHRISIENAINMAKV